jgi:small-conductance mechanosensitive channel
MIAMLSQSELPTILFAVYSIILRTLVIFSIGKDEILSILPARGFVWVFLARFIEKYYYLMLLGIIGLMIMSDPYVGGYSNLVSYLFWGLVGSALVFWVLYLLHLYIKDISAVVFFHSEEDVSRERFQNAKMWYGLFVILLFLLFVIIGLFVGARIWNIPFTFKTISEFWNTEIFVTGYDEKKNAVWFTPKKFSTALMVIFSGFVFAFAINRYVLRRIFDLLPVELGIQNTVQSLLRYIILALAVFLGFQFAGIEGFLIYVGVILASIGWMAKEPLSDFLSYFILLVQRPIQIGDYISINQDIQGVVRQVTPRSVILRRKNSFTIIVPNSKLITHEINNWNYARNFIAFDDILFTVPYDTDPVLVRQLAFKVLDQHPNILKSPVPVIRLDNFTQDGFQFMVRGFISDKYILDRWDIASSVRFELVRLLREHNIRIAVPTRYIISQNRDLSDLSGEASAKSEEALAKTDIHQRPE